MTVLDEEPALSASSPPSGHRGANLKLTFPGANPHPRLEPFNLLDTRISFFRGSDAVTWWGAVPVWGGVRYVELYPGIDLELTGKKGEWLPRLVVQPHADLDAVRLRVEGAESVAVAGDALRLGPPAVSHATYAFPLLRAEGWIGAAAVHPLMAALAMPSSPRC